MSVAGGRWKRTNRGQCSMGWRDGEVVVVGFDLRGRREAAWEMEAAIDESDVTPLRTSAWKINTHRSSVQRAGIQVEEGSITSHSSSTFMETKCKPSTLTCPEHSHTSLCSVLLLCVCVCVCGVCVCVCVCGSSATSLSDLHASCLSVNWG